MSVGDRVLDERLASRGGNPDADDLRQRRGRDPQLRPLDRLVEKRITRPENPTSPICYTLQRRELAGRLRYEEDGETVGFAPLSTTARAAHPQHGHG